MSPLTLHILAVLFLATLIRSAFGFGEALVAVPLLALRVPVSVAAPLAVLVSITVAAVILAQDWRHVHVGAAGWLIAATCFGIPLGLLWLCTVREAIVKLILAALIISFSTWSLTDRGRAHLRADHLPLLLGSGFLAGILGGAYGMNGPPLVVYGALRRWSPEQFRATLQAYFLPASLLSLAGYWVSGLWTTQVTRYYLPSLPVTFAAIFLGRALHRRLAARSFLTYVHLLLIATGSLLLLQAFSR